MLSQGGPFLQDAMPFVPGWHTTAKLTPGANLSLLPLPAGAPEPDPAEQVFR